MPPAAYTELRNRLAEVQDLSRAKSLLSWDERTMMPPKGAAARAEQRATLARVVHEKATAAELGRLFDELASYEASQPYESDEASLIRVARRDFEKSRRVPADLRAELARAASLGANAWREARAKSDFSHLLPYLEKHVELKHRYIECYPDADDPYDPLLDDFEPEMKTAEAAAVLEALKGELIPLSAAVTERAGPVDFSPLHGEFPIERQRALIDSLAAVLPLDSGSSRIDETTHPFASSLATSDIRITTRYEADFIAGSVYSFIHEFGHGLYEHGVNPALERTPLCSGVSLGLHESQSRLWENIVGRGRPFLRFFYPRMQAAFPERLGGVTLDAFYLAVNAVQPSLIRVEADEVTYNLHVVLRFELEQEIFHGKLELRDLPEAFNARVRDYLGIEVPDDAHGVLQDVHWGEGYFGYFATYTLGNIISGQIWEAVRAALPDLDDQIERGEFGPLADWLREHLYCHGRKFTPPETLERAVGKSIDAGPYLAYLRHKFCE